MSKEDNSFGSWFKSATQYSIMLLVIIVLSTILTISTKNKININFSKKENKRILMVLFLIILYIYRDSFSGWFDEIRKDAVEPGSGYFGKLFNSVKGNILSLNSGYLGGQIDFLQSEITPKQITHKLEDDSPLRTELIANNAIGYIILNDGDVYSIKSNNSKYFLESKVRRDFMTVDRIDIDINNEEYEIIFPKIEVKEIFDSTINISDILLQPFPVDTSITDSNLCSNCNIVSMSEQEAQRFNVGTLPDCVKKSDKFDENGNIIPNDKPYLCNVPKCVKTDMTFTSTDGTEEPIYNCCLVEASNTKFVCPDVCFGFENNKTEDEYFKVKETSTIDMFKSNNICSEIETKSTLDQTSEISFSDIQNMVDYDIKREQNWRTDEHFNYTSNRPQYSSSRADYIKFTL